MRSTVPVDVRSVLVLKADQIYAGYLRQICLATFGRVRVQMVNSVEAADEALKVEAFDLLVTGIGASLSGDVLAMLGRAMTRPARVRRVFVVAARREYRVLAALRSLSVDGVFDSGSEGPERLQQALRRVAGGTHYWSSTILEHLQQKGCAVGGLFHLLTVFEQVVLSVIGDGSDDLVASRELGLSPSTISTVRRELHRKLNVQHRGELVRIAAQHGFVRFTPAGVVRPGFALLAASYHPRKPRRRSGNGAAVESAPATADIAAA